MRLSRKIAVVLDDSEWGQVLDGLRCRLETYEETVRYYESGYAEIEIAEVRDMDEASQMANLYCSIIGKINQAMKKK